MVRPGRASAEESAAVIRSTLDDLLPGPAVNSPRPVRWGHLRSERTPVDVRIGVTQSPREISLELPDDLDRAALKSQIDAALTGALDVLWLTDRKGRDTAVAAAKIAFVELGSPEGERRIGFGG